MYDWDSSDLASLNIRSTWSGLSHLPFPTAETVIEKWGNTFVAIDRSSDEGGKDSERRVVATELIDQLLQAVREPLVSKPDPENMGLTPAWFEANIGRVIEDVSDGYSEAGKQRFTERVACYEHFCNSCRNCFKRFGDDDLPQVNVLIEDRDGKIVQLHTASQHHFMVPWSLDRGSSNTFNAHISRAVAALVPDGFLNKSRLLAEGIEYCGVGNASDALIDLPERSIHGHSRRVSSLFFTHDGKLLISGALDNVIKVWDADRWTERHCFDMPRIGVDLSVELASNGTTFAFNDASVIKIADVQKDSIIRELRGHTWVVRKLLFSPDGTQLASEDSDGVKVWDVATGEEVRTQPGTQLLGFSNKGIATGRREEPGMQIGRILVSKNACQQASVSDHGLSHQLVEVSHRAERHRRRWFITEDVKTIAFHPSGECVVTGHFDGHLAVWKLPRE